MNECKKFSSKETVFHRLPVVTAHFPPPVGALFTEGSEDIRGKEVGVAVPSDLTSWCRRLCLPWRPREPCVGYSLASLPVWVPALPSRTERKKYMWLLSHRHLVLEAEAGLLGPELVKLKCSRRPVCITLQPPVRLVNRSVDDLRTEGGGGKERSVCEGIM